MFEASSRAFQYEKLLIKI